MPVPVRLKIDEEEALKFWWSYVVPYFDPAREFFDYWGKDVADLQFLWHVLKPGMVFLDIGAYHGIYSLVAAKRLNGTGRVVAFEPSPREFARLRLHLGWNGIRNARAEHLAVAAAGGEKEFFQVSSGDTSRGGLRAPTSNDLVRPLTVSVVSLDDYLRKASLDRVDVVKLDVEGGELDALRGASSLLERHRPMFICEVLDIATEPWGYKAREIVSAFLSHDFEWFDLRPGGRLSAHKNQELYPEVRNYLAVPREKLGSIREWVLP
ncbi:MAG TPA: FkbM family methyltransferase [Candidatus Acidoferrum sp.]|nr:FkbM family methyltransferase [Candidatus Acidoferrum sp.]